MNLVSICLNGMQGVWLSLRYASDMYSTRYVFYASDMYSSSAAPLAKDCSYCAALAAMLGHLEW